MRSIIDQISDALDSKQYTVRDVFARGLDFKAFNRNAVTVFEEGVFRIPADIVSEAVCRTISEAENSEYDTVHETNYALGDNQNEPEGMAPSDSEVFDSSEAFAFQRLFQREQKIFDTAKQVAMVIFPKLKATALSKYEPLRQKLGEKGYNHQMRLFNDVCTYIEKSLKAMTPTDI
jgi:hypothetical protein